MKLLRLYSFFLINRFNIGRIAPYLDSPRSVCMLILIPRADLCYSVLYVHVSTATVATFRLMQ